MKNILILLTCLLMFSASTCRKVGDDCHAYISIINNSNDTIIHAGRSTKLDDVSQCILHGVSMAPGESREFMHSSRCVENGFDDFTTIEILVIDPGNYTPDIYYNCDSIEIKNKILKRFVLSLEDLKNSDFVVTYQ